MQVSPPWKGATRAGRRPAFVKFAQGDNGTGLLNSFFEHPNSYVKYVGPDNRVRSWGFYPYEDREEFAGCEDIQPMAIMQRKMATQHLYMDSTRPEQQFMDFVTKKKKHHLKGEDLGDLPRRDYILRVHMTDTKTQTGEDRIWRRFVVSGGVSLAVFQDKVLVPLMGWERNVHAFIFTDYKDGSQFGPKDSRAVDMAHIDLSGFDFLNQNEFCLAHILKDEGDAMGYMYDLGDRYLHDITVEAILPEDESCGAVEILAGSGICPMEDGSGNHNWVKRLETLRSGGATKRRETLAEIYGSINYKKRKWNFRPEFDPDWFDIEETRAAVRAALSSNASYPPGAGQVVYPMSPAAFFDMTLAQSGRNNRTTLEITPQGNRYFEELKRDRRDSAKNTACASCGNPHDLKSCSACGKRFYCSAACQKAHWKSTHKQECETLKGRKPVNIIVPPEESDNLD